MLEFLSGALEGFVEGFVSQTGAVVRSEIDHIANTLRTNIREGIKEGLDAARKTVFYILIAVGATLIGLLFLTWGLAQMFAEFFKSQGLGFLVFGVVLLLIGFISFGASKPK